MISEDDVNGNGQLDDVVGGDSAAVSINTTGVAAFKKVYARCRRGGQLVYTNAANGRALRSGKRRHAEHL